eukprot:471890_1
MASPFVKSPKLPVSCADYIPKPSYDTTNRNCIVISTGYDEYKTTPGIYKYNIVSNESQIIYKYNQTFTGEYHGQFIDTSNNTLILYGGGSYNIFKTFDLNTNQ